MALVIVGEDVVGLLYGFEFVVCCFALGLGYFVGVGCECCLGAGEYRRGGVLRDRLTLWYAFLISILVAPLCMLKVSALY